MRTLMLSAAVFAALLTTGCVSTANSDPKQTVVNEPQNGSTVFAARLQPVVGLQTSIQADNQVKIAFNGSDMFSHDGATLSAGLQQQLTQVANALSSLSFSHAMVLGHTDSSGKLAYNNKLSQQRAQQVKAFLLERGLPANQLSAEGRGPAEPIADNATAEGRAANRRVEVVVAF